MKIKATWEFDVDISDFDPKFIDVPGLAKDLTKKELGYLLEHGQLSADDFEYCVVNKCEELIPDGQTNDCEL